MKIGWKGFLGIAISVFLIWYTLRGESISDIWSQVQQANFLLLGASVFVATFGFFIRALRWKVLLAPLDPNTSLRARYAAVNIGFMANNLLPARAGEFARALSFSKLQPTVSAGGAFGSLVVERLMDGVVLVGLLVGTVLWPTFPEADLGGFATILKGGITLLGVVALILVALRIAPGPVAAAVSRVGSFFPDKISKVIDQAMQGFLTSLEVVRSPGLLITAMAWSIGFWLWHGLSFYLGMLAFGIDAGLVAAFFTEAVVGFGVAVPAAPGFFGTFHYSVSVALESVYGVDAAQTLAFAYGYHLGGFFPVTLIGLWYARQLGLSLGEVSESESAIEEEIIHGADADPKDA